MKFTMSAAAQNYLTNWIWLCVALKYNPVYARHWISWRVLIVAPIPKIPKKREIYQNWLKRTKTDWNGLILTKLDRNQQKRSKTDRNGQKRTELDRNGPKCLETKRNRCKQAETDKNLSWFRLVMNTLIASMEIGF